MPLFVLSYFVVNSLFLCKLSDGDMTCIKMLSKAKFKIIILACRCNVLNDITRNHIAEHIC